jgi:protein SCO1/2
MELYMNKAALLLLALLFLPVSSFCHETTATKADIAIEEKLGQYLPADAVFTDENNKRISLKELIDKPTIIAPVYHSCTHECPLLLSGLAQALGRLDLITPGKDFTVVALSFDDKDTPQIARDKKRNYIKAIGKPFPEEAWKFLTGDAANIRKFTDSIGFKFQKDGARDFSHPVTLVVVSPQGKIVRYLDGVSFLPFDITMAVNEAAKGTVSSTGRRLLTYCFSYDPLKKSYVFNILKVVGTVVVVFVASFLAYLILTTKRKKT